MIRRFLYDLTLESAYALPTIPLHAERVTNLEPDITIRRGGQSDFLEARRLLESHGSSSTTPWLQHRRLPDGWDYVRWPALFECLIAPDGRELRGAPLCRLSPETLQSYLLTQLVSFALLRQGVETLHATVVVVEDRAIALLGDCGTGKSTLAAAFLRAGARLLTDDLLVLRQEHDALFACPGVPRLKLMPAIAKRLLPAHAAGCAMHPLTGKRIIPLAPTQCADTPAPLRALYVLRPSQRRRIVSIRPVSTRAAWHELSRATFNLVLRDPERLRRQFAWASKLATQLPVKSISYPRTFGALSSVVDAITADLSR